MSQRTACPGSYALDRLLSSLTPSDVKPDDGEKDYTREGTAVHAVIEECLKQGTETWEFIGREVKGVKCSPKMLDGADAFIAECRPLIEGAEAWGCEFKIHNPEFHPLFKGTIDFWAIKDGVLYVRDYKNGFLIVEPSAMQPRYYALGVLQLHDGVRRVNIGIVQPNAPHPHGTVRTVVYAADEIHSWAHDVLLPAMLRAERDTTLTPGEHCRFCKSKLVCPMVKGMFAAAAHCDPSRVSKLTDAQLGMEYPLIGPVKMYLKAVEEEIFRRSNQGHKIPGTKLVAKRAERVWKDGARETFEGAYPNHCYEEPKFKSPAQMEQINSVAKTLVHQWAYAPDSGVTLAPASDPKPEIKVKPITEVFAKYAEIDL